MDERWRVDLIVEAGRETLDELWEVFLNSLEHLRERSAIKQIVYRDEFDALFADPRVIKVAVRDRHHDLRPAGLTIVSNDLAALPEPSADYFRARWPEHYDAGRVWYVSYLLVAPDYMGTTAGPLMIGFTLDLVSVEHGGVIGIDVSETNEERVRFAKTLPRIADRLFARPVTGLRLDAQLFYAFEVPAAPTG
ncbi:MAG: hypothetical protein U0Q19_19705 [Kineosporiaceae bacterium]